MVVNLYYTATSDLPISQITQTYSLGPQDGGEPLLEFNNRLSNWQTTPTKSLWLQHVGESLLYYVRLTHFTHNTNNFTVTAGWWWMSTTLQHQTYPFHRQHQHLHCDYRMVVNLYYTATSDLPISQITPTTSLWLHDGSESLLHCNIRLTHFTDNTDMFTVTTGWWWISTTLQNQTSPFHR